jgi:hypothetical protein
MLIYPLAIERFVFTSNVPCLELVSENEFLSKVSRHFQASVRCERHLAFAQKLCILPLDMHYLGRSKYILCILSMFNLSIRDSQENLKASMAPSAAIHQALLMGAHGGNP